MAIDALVQAIVNLLQVPLSDAVGAPAMQVSVSAPNGASATADLVLFLYLITPDPDLRNADRMRPYPPDYPSPRSVEGAVPLDLRFLVTTGAAADNPIQSFGRLATAVRLIEAASPLTLPTLYQPAIWLSLLPLETDEMARIWGLFPNENCRSSFAFRASPLWIDPASVAPIAASVRSDSAGAGRVPEQA